MTIAECFDTNLVETLKNEFKNKKLKREELNDEVFVEILSRLSIEDRFSVLEACMYNDTFRRIRYRKTKA